MKDTLVSEVNSEILSAVRALAEEEGEPLQALIDEALADLVEKHAKSKPRLHVMEAYATSHQPYTSLYRKLAK